MKTVRFFSFFLILIVPFAFAGVSILTGAVVIGGDKVYDYYFKRELDRVIQRTASAAGEVCSLTEHFEFPNGLTISRVLLLKSSLESAGWRVEEVLPYFRQAVWIARRGRLEVLILISNRSDFGFVSFCQW